MILNLTQHAATQEQVSAGVVDMPEELRAKLATALTFDNAPTRKQLYLRGRYVLNLVAQTRFEGRRAMIGGAPFFMSTLERVLLEAGITPVYAFSKRESVEEVKADGSVVKINVFQHVGFVSADRRRDRE